MRKPSSSGPTSLPGLFAFVPCIRHTAVSCYNRLLRGTYLGSFAEVGNTRIDRNQQQSRRLQDPGLATLCSQVNPAGLGNRSEISCKQPSGRRNGADRKMIDGTWGAECRCFNPFPPFRSKGLLEIAKRCFRSTRTDLRRITSVSQRNRPGAMLMTAGYSFHQIYILRGTLGNIFLPQPVCPVLPDCPSQATRRAIEPN